MTRHTQSCQSHVTPACSFGVLRGLLVLAGLAALCQTAKAQKDTTAPAKVTIVSSYKPTLRPVSKIDLTPSQLPPDTNRTVRPYEIPIQQLVYSYQPVAVRPLALDVDNDPVAGDPYFVKAGFGNYRTPLLQAAAHFGDARERALGVYADYMSSKGKIEFQDFSRLQLQLRAHSYIPGHQLTVQGGFTTQRQYLYGYDKSLYTLDRDSVRQRFNTIQVFASLRDTISGARRIHYEPYVSFSDFRNTGRVREWSLQASVPLSMGINEHFRARTRIDWYTTGYRTEGLNPADLRLTNRTFLFNPSVDYGQGFLRMNAGLNLIRNNGKTYLLPNITGEMSFLKDLFYLQGGWVSGVFRNTYQNLTVQNPYLGPLTEQNNTITTEFYGGVKTIVGKHVQVSAKASFIAYRDFPFLINDTVLGKPDNAFITANENRMGNIRLSGDISYVIRDVFDLNGSVVINRFTGLETNARPWNTLPIECRAALRWKVMGKLDLRSRFWFFGGGLYPTPGGQDRRLTGAADWSLGAEYKIKKQFSVFTDLNNIFGKRYERWPQYPVYGFNAIVGLSLRFGPR